MFQSVCLYEMGVLLFEATLFGSLASSNIPIYTLYVHVNNDYHSILHTCVYVSIHYSILITVIPVTNTQDYNVFSHTHTHIYY